MTPRPLLPRQWTQAITPRNVLNISSIPSPAQNYVAGNFRKHCTAHAGFLLCFMSPEAEDSFPERAQALFAGFQDLYQHPVTVDDARRYPTAFGNAYIAGQIGSKQRTTFSKANLTTRTGQAQSAPSPAGQGE